MIRLSIAGTVWFWSAIWPDRVSHVVNSVIPHVHSASIAPDCVVAGTPRKAASLRGKPGNATDPWRSIAVGVDNEQIHRSTHSGRTDRPEHCVDGLAKGKDLAQFGQGLCAVCCCDLLCHGKKEGKGARIAPGRMEHRSERSHHARAYRRGPT